MRHAAYTTAFLVGGTLALLFGCGRAAPAPVAGPAPALYGLSQFFEAASPILELVMPLDRDCAGGSGNNSVVRMGGPPPSGHCKRTAYNSYRGTPEEADKWLNDIQSRIVALAGEKGAAVDGKPATKDPPACGFGLSYRSGTSTGTVVISLTKLDQQSGVAIEPGQSAWRLHVEFEEFVGAAAAR